MRGKAGKPGDERRLPADQVGEPAAEQQQAAERERVGGDHPLPFDVGEVQGLLVTSLAEPEDRELYRLARRMFAANPDLGALRTARMTAAVREGAAVIAADTGSAPDAVGPRLAAAAAAAIAMEIVDTEPGAEREQAVAAAMRFLEAGIAAL